MSSCRRKKVQKMSKFAAKVAKWYDAGIWTEQMVRDVYAKGKLTDEELAAILGEDEPAE